MFGILKCWCFAAVVGRCQEFQAFNTSPRAAASHATLGLYGWSGTQILVFCSIVFRLMNLSMQMKWWDMDFRNSSTYNIQPAPPTVPAWRLIDRGPFLAVCRLSVLLIFLIMGRAGSNAPCNATSPYKFQKILQTLFGKKWEYSIR